MNLYVVRGKRSRDGKFNDVATGAVPFRAEPMSYAESTVSTTRASGPPV